jgi:regulator of nucleoside diphosphate kinase
MRVREVRPSITITRPDYDRLFNLIDSSQVAPSVGDFLLDELQRARIVAPGDVAPTVVTMQSRFIFRDEGTGESRRATLVYPDGENIDEGCISILTPFGAALLGLSEGQSIEFETRVGERRVVSLVRVISQRVLASDTQAQ